MERHRTKRKYGQWTCGTMLEVVIVVCVCVCMWCVHLHVCVHMCTCIHSPDQRIALGISLLPTLFEKRVSVVLHYVEKRGSLMKCFQMCQGQC